MIFPHKTEDRYKMFGSLNSNELSNVKGGCRCDLSVSLTGAKMTVDGDNDCVKTCSDTWGTWNWGYVSFVAAAGVEVLAGILFLKLGRRFLPGTKS